MREPREHLEHDGVHLRRWRTGDAAAVLRVVRDSLAEFEPWFPWATSDYGLRDAEGFVATALANWESGKAHGYAIVDADGQVIGTANLMARIGPGGLEVGYWLDSAHVGEGIMRRAVRAVTAEAFRIGATHVEIHHDENNLRSRAVPESLGFTPVDRYRSADERISPRRTGYNLVWRRGRAG